MLPIISLLALGFGQISARTQLISPAGKSSSPSTISTISKEVGLIDSETCQKARLRQFDLMSIDGFKVNKLIYLQTKDILRKANADSVPMGLTSTFRKCAEQVTLRAQNCPSASSPTESCTPPTEPPGDSLHNYGLAIDYKCTGFSTFEKSPCYTWLQANASKYRLHRRVDEAWHWSFTGQ